LGVALDPMSRSLFSNSWYRVAGLKPRLRAHTRIHRQVYRSRIWHVLQDPQSGRFHSLSELSNLMVCLMDGRRTVQEIWEAAGRHAPADPATQDETIQLLAQLHSADLLQGEFPPDFEEMAERSQTSSHRRMMAQLRNPMAIRLPLFDPDRLLTLTAPLVRPLFTLPGFLAWAALVLTGFVLAALHWPELTGDVADRVLTAESVLLLLCVYPVVKSLHELGHAYATKSWGGEVHEVGVMLLVFIPVLYVDASASAAFKEKRRRVIVGAAGILVEMALAAVAMILWTRGAPGFGRTVAFNVMLIGGVSTLLFNGNPLLRFDGYYIFSDLVEIPNLGTRANAYVFYLIQRHLFGIDELETPVAAASERKWLLVYAVLSFLYRMLVSLGIAVFLATKLIVVGLVMALWPIFAIMILPALKGAKFLAASPRLQGRRRRAVGLSLGAAALVVAGLFLVPLPYATVAEGVVITPDQSEVRAGTEGFVREVTAAAGAEVEPHQTLVALRDPILDARIGVLDAEIAEAEQRLEAARIVDRVQAEMFERQAAHLRDRLAALEKQRGQLDVSAAQGGRFCVSRPEDLPGRYVKRGELIGYVVADAAPVVRLLVSQGEVDLIRGSGAVAEARSADDPARRIAARLLRVAPAAQVDVPSLALTTRGGGAIALDPNRVQRLQALFSYFQVDVELDEPQGPKRLGSKIYVRFKLPDQAVAWRLLRAGRQYFLGQFHV
jgi:putative peptide zinc metalloprotease protein